MYGYQVVFEHPSCRRKRSVLQILSKRRFSSVIQLLRAEGLYEEYRDWRLVDFSIANATEPEQGMKSATNELPANELRKGAILDLVA